jgi:hypothetical protein
MDCSQADCIYGIFYVLYHLTSGVQLRRTSLMEIQYDSGKLLCLLPAGVECPKLFETDISSLNLLFNVI